MNSSYIKCLNQEEEVEGKEGEEGEGELTNAIPSIDNGWILTLFWLNS